MSDPVRRHLYELLQSMPDGNAVARISALGEFLAGLPVDQVPGAERRILALTVAYRAMLEDGPKGTLEEFFKAVDAAEQDLLN